jgi:hypothetical protein
VDYYKKEFPTAVRFKEETILPEAIPEEDKGNDTYVVVYGKEDKVMGYLRDFNGPVTSEENCPCNPLSLTLAFEPDYTLRNIFSIAPLQKYGHENLTDEEHKQMVEIAKAPAHELLLLQYPQDMIDGTTGATSTSLEGKVVAKAGYSTWRISRLAMHTSRVLQGMPIMRDQQRLQAKLAGVEEPEKVMEILIEFIPTSESNHLKKQVLSLLA